jgi:hypothetical protein
MFRLINFACTYKVNKLYLIESIVNKGKTP